MESIGWLGATLLAFCGLPQAITCYREKHAVGVSSGFLVAWFVGELLTLIYVFPKLDLPLLFNYSANLIFISVIGFYKISPSKPQQARQAPASPSKPQQAPASPSKPGKPHQATPGHTRLAKNFRLDG